MSSDLEFPKEFSSKQLDLEAEKTSQRSGQSKKTKSEGDGAVDDERDTCTTGGCDWGFSRQECQGNDGDLVSGDSDSSKIIPIYEKYLQDKKSLAHQTKNHSMFSNNSQRAIREWFDNEGHEFDMTTKQPRDNQFICSLDLPIDDLDFTLTSEVHSSKQDAIEEVCMLACRMLDECGLLYTWQSSSNNKEYIDNKRHFDEANKEDDIEFDDTNSKRVCSNSLASSSSDARRKATPKVNTYESLMAKWSELNMSIIQLKARLVRMDLSMAGNKQQLKEKRILAKTNDCDGNPNGSDREDENSEEKDEVDPLDEFMSGLEAKTKLTIDEKIEKSRIKAQIAAYEREQSEVSRFIELAKPHFDLNKACPPSSNRDK